MLVRQRKNPILEPSRIWWEDQAVFNPAVIKIRDKIHLIYRAVGNYENYISRLGHAIFDENLNLIKRFKNPVLSFKKRSCEDPRITQIKDKLFMTYVKVQNPSAPPKLREKVGLRNNGIRWKFSTFLTKLEIERDKCKFRGHKKITKENDKDVVLFPDKIKNKHVILHRPFESLERRYEIKIANLNISKGLIHDSRVLLKAGDGEWMSKVIGAGCPPIKTDKGWLIIFHGTDDKYIYSAGAALLDLEDPSKIIAISKNSILKPETKYEKKGDIDNVVFPTGTVNIGEKLYVFYGAADKTCCAASVNLKYLVDDLLMNKI